MSHAPARQPTVSVIMPVYNAERFLHSAIQSILGQSFADFELLVLDDGSTDSSAAIIASFDDPRIMVHRAPANRGLVYQLNLGIEKARGKYLARMDADDIAREHRLRRQVTFMDSHPDVGACGTYFRSFDARRRYRVSLLPTSHDAICAYLLFGNPIAHPTLMLRRSVLERTGIRYATGKDSCEDYHLYVDLHAHTKLANVPYVGLNYRLHATNMSKTHAAFQQSTAAEKQREYVRDFYGAGSPSDQDALVHEHLAMSGSVIGTMAECSTFVAWLESVRGFNERSGRFNPREFTRGLGHFLYRKVVSQRLPGTSVLSLLINRHRALFAAVPARYRFLLIARSFRGSFSRVGGECSGRS